MKVRLVLTLLPLASIAAPTPAQEKEPPASEFKEIVDELRRRYPDRERAVRARDIIIARLLEFAEHHPNASEISKAFGLAAQLHNLAGEGAKARDLWRAMDEQGVDAEERARGLYLLGDYYFLRESYRSAYIFLSQLEGRYPDSRWTRAARRPLRYLKLVRDGHLPLFEAQFRLGGKKKTYSVADLKGKVTLLYFWRRSSASVAELHGKLRENIPKVIAQYPVLEGRIVVLGVNLDRSAEVFEAGLRRLKGTDWPQHHDGKGFKGPLASLLAIPRTPHFVAVDAGGRIVYLGSDVNAFLGRASAALKELRTSL